MIIIIIRNSGSGLLKEKISIKFDFIRATTELLLVWENRTNHAILNSMHEMRWLRLRFKLRSTYNAYMLSNLLRWGRVCSASERLHLIRQFLNFATVSEVTQFRADLGDIFGIRFCSTHSCVSYIWNSTQSECCSEIHAFHHQMNESATRTFAVHWSVATFWCTTFSSALIWCAVREIK